MTEALLDALGSDFTIACPAFPKNGRTIFHGHLFVGDQLLAESPMRDHPLTPMTDSNLVRVLGRQMRTPTGLVGYREVAQGAAAVAEAFDRLRGQGCRAAIVDAVADDDLMAIGRASAGLALVTGGSGVAMGLPENFRAAGLLTADGTADALQPIAGHAAVLAGRSWELAQDAESIANRSDCPPPRSLQPPEAPASKDYGLRDFAVVDPWGHHLSFGQAVRDEGAT